MRIRVGREDLAMLSGLLALGVGVPLLIGVVAGSLEIPRNDDWAYRRIAGDLAQTGRFVLDGITETMIVGQILITQPLLWLAGVQPAAFAGAGIAFATFGILAAYGLGRTLLTSRDAALAAALLALFPGYLAYSVSYMSDVPTLAAQFLCLGLGAVAIRSRPVRMGVLLSAVLVGILAFSIREFAVAAPASVLLAAVCAEPRRARHWIIFGLFVTICAAIHIWRTSLPGQLPQLGPGLGSLDDTVLAFTTAAFALAPAALVGAIRWRPVVRRLDVLVGVAIGLDLVVVRSLRWIRDGAFPPILNENLVTRWGTHAGYLEGPRSELFSEPLWIAVNVTALVATVAVLGIVTGIVGTYLRHRRRRPVGVLSALGSPAGVLAIFCLGVLFGLFAFGISRPVFDRYFWPIIPPAAILLLLKPSSAWMPATSAPRPNFYLAGAAVVMTVILSTTSLLLALNSHAFSAARWRAGEQLVAAGVPPDQIDAGYEWMGYYASSPGDPTRQSEREPFYRNWWPFHLRCGVVTSDPMAQTGAVLVGTVDYQLNLIRGPSERIYLYRYPIGECPTG